MNRIGAYKTDVENWSTAKNILTTIRRQFRNCDVSFDLEDCDNILRVESKNGPADEAAIKKSAKAWLLNAKINLKVKTNGKSSP